MKMQTRTNDSKKVKFRLVIDAEIGLTVIRLGFPGQPDISPIFFRTLIYVQQDNLPKKSGITSSRTIFNFVNNLLFVRVGEKLSIIFCKIFFSRYSQDRSLRNENFLKILNRETINFFICSIFLFSKLSLFSKRS